MRLWLTIALLLLDGSRLGVAQGFVNLDFESAQIVSLAGNPNYPYGIATTNAMPGWVVTAYGSLTPAPWITFNDPALGSSAVNLWATNGQQISGNYSVLLQGGMGPGVSISQTGMVPDSAESLIFAAQETGAGTLQVSLGGQILSLSTIGTGSGYTMYGAAIPSSMDGQTEQLMFSALTVPEGYGLNNWNIDNIQFSPSGVPEPRICALSALGGLLFAWRRGKKGSVS